MRVIKKEGGFSKYKAAVSARVLIVAGFFLAVVNGQAQIPPGGGGGGGYDTTPPLESWFFSNPTNWPSSSGTPPLSFTNLGFSYLGNGASLVLDTNVPAWLNYSATKTNGAVDLTLGTGSVTFWFAPDWSSTNVGGLGPQEPGRLFEVGAYTTNSNFGWESIYVDAGGNHIFFSAQTNDGLGDTYTISAPISWTTNYFHFISLTCSTNGTALYIDGGLATNGPPLTVYPGTNVLASGFFVGSSSSGLNQSHGLFNTLETFNYPLDAGTIGYIFNAEFGMYMLNPWNVRYMSGLYPAPSSPSYSDGTYDAISGQGNLQWVGAASSCSYGTNADNIWITNITATAAGNGTMNVTFSIEGGADGTPYDVFANSILSFGPGGMPWTWMGQGMHCNTYALTNLPSRTCFIILGTPQDTSLSGLTDAYELLVEKIDPNGAQSDSYGVPYAWYAQNGLSLTSATQDPDQDALLNYQEYFYGTRPTVSEGFTIWAGIQNGSIP